MQNVMWTLKEEPVHKVNGRGQDLGEWHHVTAALGKPKKTFS